MGENKAVTVCSLLSEPHMPKISVDKNTVRYEKVSSVLAFPC